MGLSTCIIPDYYTINEEDYIKKVKKFCNSCFNVANKYLTKSGFEIEYIENIQ